MSDTLCDTRLIVLKLCIGAVSNIICILLGLSALKTPQSYEPGCSGEDPLHLPAFQKLAEGLPFAKYDRSKLVCSVTREVMNEQNPPKVLPNGYVYSQTAIDRLKDDNGRIRCPKTGTFPVFIDSLTIFLFSKGVIPESFPNAVLGVAGPCFCFCITVVHIVGHVVGLSQPVLQVHL